MENVLYFSIKLHFKLIKYKLYTRSYGKNGSKIILVLIGSLLIICKNEQTFFYHALNYIRNIKL